MTIAPKQLENGSKKNTIKIDNFNPWYKLLEPGQDIVC